MFTILGPTEKQACSQQSTETHKTDWISRTCMKNSVNNTKKPTPCQHYILRHMHQLLHPNRTHFRQKIYVHPSHCSLKATLLVIVHNCISTAPYNDETLISSTSTFKGLMVLGESFIVLGTWHVLYDNPFTIPILKSTIHRKTVPASTTIWLKNVECNPGESIMFHLRHIQVRKSKETEKYMCANCEAYLALAE
jgi:hypothetical protein